VIVLLKAVLANVTALITQPMSQQQSGLTPGYRSEVNLRANSVQQNRQQDPAIVPLPSTVDPLDLPINEIEALRSREITAKAVSGILLILLKWFKVSRKFMFDLAWPDLIFCRYLEVRVLHATSVGLELSALGLEAVCPPRDR
jgi:hypothetical protein